MLPIFMIALAVVYFALIADVMLLRSSHYYDTRTPEEIEAGLFRRNRFLSQLLLIANIAVLIIFIVLLVIASRQYPMGFHRSNTLLRLLFVLSCFMLYALISHLLGMQKYDDNMTPEEIEASLYRRDRCLNWLLPVEIIASLIVYSYF